MDRALATVAIVSAACHALAGLAGIVWMAGAMPSTQVDPLARWEYVQAHASTWRLAWGIWALAAISFVTTLVLLAPVDRWGRVGIVVASVGLAVDMAGQAAHSIAPRMSQESFLLWEAWAVDMTTMRGNTLYAVAGIIVVASAERAKRINGFTAWASAPAWAAALALSVLHLSGPPMAETAAATALLVLLSAWLAWLGVTHWRASQS